MLGGLLFALAARPAHGADSNSLSWVRLEGAESCIAGAGVGPGRRGRAPPPRLPRARGRGRDRGRPGGARRGGCRALAGGGAPQRSRRHRTGRADRRESQPPEPST
ncbi:MAG: hypothetical protein EXR71_02275 [Myxococcales bacterium]|nr:hypothetical protein [Myxococcales bacterium]